MDFHILQVSLLPDDSDLFYEQGRERDIRLFEQALDHAQEKLDGYSIKVMTYDDVHGVMSGVVSRRAKQKLYDKDFASHIEDNYPPVVWFWDRNEQVVLVEQKTSVFTKAEQSAKAFKDISALFLGQYVVHAEIFPKLTDDAFWETYEMLSHVYRVEFELAAPNMFGETKKELGDFLKKVTKQTNASDFQPTFINRRGNLRLLKSKWVQAMQDWINDGAGAWLVVGRKSIADRMRRYRSQNMAKTINYPAQISESDLSELSSEDIQIILEQLRSKYTFRK